MILSMPREVKKAVVLAAGKGSRLYPVTHHIAKPLLPIANRPTLHYAFDALKEIGIHDICLVVGENEGQMRDALGDGSGLGIKLSYVRQLEPKGLAHAVGFAQEWVGDDPFALYLGDAIYSHSLAPGAKMFAESDCANVNLVCYVDDPRRYGVANLDGDRIVKLVEKPANPESNYAMAGVYFFGPELWEVLTELPPSARGEYEITDAIQHLVDGGKTVLASKYEGVWFDTGTLPSFIETSEFLTKGVPLIGDGAEVEATLSGTVVIGANAKVRVTRLENSVVLPGAVVEGDYAVSGCLLGGNNQLKSELVDVIQFDGAQK